MVDDRCKTCHRAKNRGRVKLMVNFIQVVVGGVVVVVGERAAVADRDTNWTRPLLRKILSRVDSQAIRWGR
jgi:hypothetical protein